MLEEQTGAASLTGADAAAGGPPPRDIRSRLTLARLPAMPQILLRLLDLCHREDASLADLATLVSRDAGLVARLLSLASASAFHGRSRPATLEQCLALLGMNAIKTIVINDSVLQVFNRFTGGRDVDLREFWGHSLRAALLARALARRMDYPSPDEAYLAGLMHDVGRLAMLATDPEGYSRIFHELADDDALCARENEVFALTHTEVGAWLVGKWELDSFIGDGVLYHHEPAERVAAAHPLVRIVLLANRLAALCGREPAPAEMELAALCGAGGADLGGLVEAVEVELITVAEQLGIQLAAPQPAPLPAADLPAEERQLAARIRDLLLVDRVLAATGDPGSRESALTGIVQAFRLLFDVEAALCFEPADASGRFRGRPLGPRWGRGGQLEFQRGRSDSFLARALDRGPQLVARGAPGLHLLDDQILRLLGGEGVLYLPLGSRRSPAGVLAAGLDTGPRREALQARAACLDHFGRVGGDLLAAAGAGADGYLTRVNSLAHEISNPLSIIRNYLHILEAECAGKAVGQPQLGIVREEIDRVARILDAARGQPVRKEPGPVALNRLIEDLLALGRGWVAPEVEVRLDLAAELPEIASDGDGLKQLLLNLFKNAVEALPRGGQVRIATAPWGTGAGATHAEICIEDDGPGIPREVLARLYQPVASTKGGEHQGLGLAIVGQLVRELRGLINCRSSAQGTRFQVLLPFNGK